MRLPRNGSPVANALWAVCGAIMMAYLRNRCAALEWPNYVQEIIVGHIILLAVGLDFARRSFLASSGRRA